MKVAVRRFSVDSSGLSSPEYALLLALIVMACIGSAEALSSGMNQTMESLNEQIGQEATSAPTTAPATVSSAPKVAHSPAGP